MYVVMKLRKGQLPLSPPTHRIEWSSKFKNIGFKALTRKSAMVLVEQACWLALARSVGSSYLTSCYYKNSLNLGGRQL